MFKSHYHYSKGPICNDRLIFRQLHFLLFIIQRDKKICLILPVGMQPVPVFNNASAMLIRWGSVLWIISLYFPSHRLISIISKHFKFGFVCPRNIFQCSIVHFFRIIHILLIFHKLGLLVDLEIFILTGYHILLQIAIPQAQYLTEMSILRRAYFSLDQFSNFYVDLNREIHGSNLLFSSLDNYFRHVSVFIDAFFQKIET